LAKGRILNKENKASHRVGRILVAIPVNGISTCQRPLRVRHGEDDFQGSGVATTKIKEQVAEENPAETAVDVVFWILIIVLAVVIFSHFNWNPRPRDEMEVSSNRRNNEPNHAFPEPSP